MSSKSSAPIIIVRKKVAGHDDEHGGAWKVAYADFVTAMMALFIVLWLLSASEKVQKAVGGYFQDPTGNGRQTGSTNAGSGEILTLNKTELEKLKEKLEQLLRQIPALENMQNQIKIKGIRSLDDVRTWRGRLATFSREVEEERRGVKEFLYKNLYYSAALDPEKNDGERVIRGLFEFWMANPENLPTNYREKAELEPLPRVVCDYIAGMTDHYVEDLRKKLLAGKDTGN